MSSRSGFVIAIALLVTVAAVAVVAALKLKSNVDFALRARVKSDIQLLDTNLREYQTMNGSFPTTEQGLRALVQEPANLPRLANWRRLLGEILLDPWGTEYVYRCPGVKNPTRYDLFSAGPDRKADTPDDVWGE